MTDETPQNVAQAATLNDALSLDGLTLIGLFSGPESPTALIRSDRGNIARVSAGESIFGLQIAAIDADRIILTDRTGTQHVMVVPGS